MPRPLLSILSLGILASSGWSAEWLIICAGQSNMDGRAPIADLPAEMKDGPRNVTCYRWGNPAKPQPRTPMYGPNDKAFGPEASMVNALATARPHDTFIVAKYAVGGTALWQWVPDYTAPDGFRKPTDTAALGHLYETLRPGVQAVAKLHPNAKPLAFCWLQGESDEAPAVRPPAYLPNLRRLVANARKDFNAPGLAFIAAEPACGPAEISDAFRTVAKDDPAAAFIPCRELPHKDRAHFNGQSVLLIGRHFAEEILKRMPQDTGR